MIGISVVTPSLNQGRFIERTIRSVLDQGYSPLEYVVCDAESTDETSAILDQFGDQLRLIREPDTGQAQAVNKGIRATSGEVIGWLNSDDVYLSGTLFHVAELFAAKPEIDVIYGDAQLIDADDAVLGTYYTEPWSATRLVERCILSQPAVFFRRRVVDQFGLLDERLHYCLDYEYWLRLAAFGATFLYEPRMLASTRQYPETKTLSARLAVHDELNTMLHQHLGRVPDRWLLNHAHTLVELGRAHVLPNAMEVVLRALYLSWHWNRSVSPALCMMALTPIFAGARRRLASGRLTVQLHG